MTKDVKKITENIAQQLRTVLNTKTAIDMDGTLLINAPHHQLDKAKALFEGIIKESLSSSSKSGIRNRIGKLFTGTKPKIAVNLAVHRPWADREVIVEMNAVCIDKALFEYVTPEAFMTAVGKHQDRLKEVLKFDLAAEIATRDETQRLSYLARTQGVGPDDIQGRSGRT